MKYRTPTAINELKYATIAPSLAKRKLVDSENAWRGNGPFGECAYDAQQRGPARRHG
jgi:hypothetical protein